MASKKTKSKGNAQQENLYKVYKQLDEGKITADKFIEKVENEVGIQANANFRSYMRTTASERPMFGKIQQTLKVAQPNRSEAIVPNVNPYDVKFHRGGPSKPAPIVPATSKFQDDMSGVISSYLKGECNRNDFRAQLLFKDIKIDDKLEGMIRKVECGDNVSYNQFGTHIFRQLNGSDCYNRVDKINMNNVNIVSPEKTGKAFNDASNLQEQKHHNDDMQLEEENRIEAFGFYVPKKGAGAKEAQNAFKSNLFNILDMDRSKESGGQNEYVNGFKPKNNSIQMGQKNLLTWDESRTEQAMTHTRKPHSNHPCLQTSGNLW